MKVFELKPIIFKSENGQFRDVSLDIDYPGNVIRGTPSQGKGRSGGEVGRPGWRDKALVQLFKQRLSLHV
jgi:hypothetical protein